MATTAPPTAPAEEKKPESEKKEDVDITELTDYSSDEEAPAQAQGQGKDKKMQEAQKKYVFLLLFLFIHPCDRDLAYTLNLSSFKDFLLKPELLRTLVDNGFEHPSEGLQKSPGVYTHPTHRSQ